MADDSDQFAPQPDTALSRLHPIFPKQRAPSAAQSQPTPATSRLHPIFPPSTPASPDADVPTTLSQRMSQQKYPKSDRGKETYQFKPFSEYAKNILPDIGSALSYGAQEIASGLTPSETRSPVDRYLPIDSLRVAANLGLGGLDMLGAPVAGTAHALIGDPVTDKTGSRTLGDLAETAATMVSPNLAIKQAAGGVAKQIAKRTSKEAPEATASDLVDRWLPSKEEQARIDEELSHARHYTPGMTLADLYPPGNLHSIVSTAGRAPGEASRFTQQTLRERQQGVRDAAGNVVTPGAAERVEQGMQAAFGTPMVRATDKARLKARSEEAAEGYRKAWSSDAETYSPALQELLKLPDMKPIIQNAKANFAAAQRRPASERDPTEPTAFEKIVVGKTKDGKGKTAQVPTMKMWGNIYQSLNEERRKLGDVNPITGMTAEQRKLDSLRNELKAALSEKNSDFKAANQKYYEASEVIRAREWGETFLSPQVHGEDAVAHISEMNDEQKAAARNGLSRTLIAAFDQVPGDEGFVGKILDTPFIQKKIAPLFRSEEERRRFTELVRNEVKMNQTYRGFGNPDNAMGKMKAQHEYGASETGRNLNQVLAGAEVAKGISKLAFGDVTGAFPAMIGLRYGEKEKAAQRRFEDPKVMDALARMLFSPKATLTTEAPGMQSIRGVGDAAKAQRQAQINAAGQRAKDVTQALGISTLLPGIEQIYQDNQQ